VLTRAVQLEDAKGVSSKQWELGSVWGGEKESVWR
jgi:hypothetical protein